MAYYGVWQGRNIGIYSSWNECKLQVDGYKGAKYKKLNAQNEQEAKNEFFEAMKNFQKKELNNKEQTKIVTQVTQLEKKATIVQKALDYPDGDYLTVDGAAQGQENCEYQAVFSSSKKLAFKSKVFKGGTNNIGEFLGLVEAIKYILNNKITPIVYSDSVTAIAWIKYKKAKTTARDTGKITDELEKLLQEAENFLVYNTEDIEKISIRKWNTKDWGEIPADYGRK